MAFAATLSCGHVTGQDDWSLLATGRSAAVFSRAGIFQVWQKERQHLQHRQYHLDQLGVNQPGWLKLFQVMLVMLGMLPTQPAAIQPTN